MYTPVIGYSGFTHISFLRSDHNHTVSGPSTVNSSSSSIFQYADGFDIVDIYATDTGSDQVTVSQYIIHRRVYRIIQNHTVYHPQRLYIPADSRRTPDSDLRHSTRSSGSAHNGHTGYLSLQKFIDIRLIHRFQGFHIYGSNGRSQFPALDFLVTGDNYFIHFAQLFFEDDIEFFLSGIIHLLRFHTDKREAQDHSIDFRNF